MTSLSDDEYLWEKARRIQFVISQEIDKEKIRIGFKNLSKIDYAYARLKKFGFSKPFFYNKRQWIRDIIYKNMDAYLAVAFNIELETVIDGKLRLFDGFGRIKKEYVSNVPHVQKMMDNLKEPEVIIIQIGERNNLLDQLLELE